MLAPALASRFARIALDNVVREYPNKPAHVLDGPGDVSFPRTLHPAFYGSYDWHSCVHMHWLLARLLRTFPTLPEAPAIAALLDRHLASAAIAGEVAYLARPGTASFERTYGWAWLLKLAEELGRGAGQVMEASQVEAILQLVLDCENLGRGFYIHRGESSETIVQGFTVRRGAGIQDTLAAPGV